eukprot:TRINITY_DN2342_c0_g1_i1.p1 TRINITY_DN2342_c0_g1~~TRINITY_DN2342_c0_g1_i1.p1  ORF type:complete len:362 (+),score=102.40 TRINITY_DN2342_c0_g1_i1:107-1192(+)
MCIRDRYQRRVHGRSMTRTSYPVPSQCSGSITLSPRPRAVSRPLPMDAMAKAVSQPQAALSSTDRVWQRQRWPKERPLRHPASTRKSTDFGWTPSGNSRSIDSLSDMVRIQGQRVVGPVHQAGDKGPLFGCVHGQAQVRPGQLGRGGQGAAPVVMRLIQQKGVEVFAVAGVVARCVNLPKHGAGKPVHAHAHRVAVERGHVVVFARTQGGQGRAQRVAVRKRVVGGDAHEIVRIVIGATQEPGQHVLLLPPDNGHALGLPPGGQRVVLRVGGGGQDKVVRVPEPLEPPEQEHEHGHARHGIERLARKPGGRIPGLDDQPDAHAAPPTRRPGTTVRTVSPRGASPAPGTGPGHPWDIRRRAG